MFSQFINSIQLDSLRVKSPQPFIMVCGGLVETDSNKPIASMRDAFNRIINFPELEDAELILAENLTRDHSLEIGHHYPDFLKFEDHIAQVSDLIILFSESEGSIAELGAFSMVPEITKKLLVIIDENYYRDDSFIKLGPLKRMLSSDNNSVYTVNSEDIGISFIECNLHKPHKSHSKISITNLKQRLSDPISRKLAKAKEPSAFDKNRDGHTIKLICGMVQEFGAMRLDEIITVLELVTPDLEEAAIPGYLLCAKSLQWIAEDRKGDSTYYFAVKSDINALEFKMKPNPQVEKDRLRRRASILKHWQELEPNRFRGIVEHQGIK